MIGCAALRVSLSAVSALGLERIKQPCRSNWARSRTKPSGVSASATQRRRRCSQCCSTTWTRSR